MQGGAVTARRWPAQAPVTVFLDLDDTLLDFRRAEAIAIGRTLQQLGIAPTQAMIDRYSAINAAQWRLLEEGRLTRAEVLTRRFELLFAELDVSCPSVRAQEIYEKLLGQGHYFIPGAPELLARLHRHYALYLASNGTAAVQDRRIASAGIARYFRGIFISERIGFDKPAAEFFERCFARIPNFDRRRAIMVGDSLTSDMLGARNAGIVSCWFNPAGRPPRADIRPDWELSRLDGLPELLVRIFGPVSV